MLNSRNFRVGIRLVGNTTLTGATLGDLQSYTVDGKLYYNDGTGNSPIVTEASSGTISNKTINISTTTFADGSDPTKHIVFNDSGAATGTTLTLNGIQSVNRALTFPDATDTLVGRATVDTLTNKSISGSANTITNISLTSSVTGILPIANGGTNASTKTGAFDSLSPMTTGGDLIYGGASGTGTRLANGSAGQVLTSAGTTLAPTWTTPSPGFVNPMTTVGDIIIGGSGGSAQRLAATTNGFVLTLSSGSPIWAVASGGTTSIGTINSQSKSANGLVITGSSLVAQTADASFPGMVSTGTQSFSGAKTFSTSIATPTISDTGTGIGIASGAGQNITLTTSGGGHLKLSGGNGTEIAQEGSTPSPPTSGYDSIYPKSDDLFYQQTSAGVETLVGSIQTGATTYTAITTPSTPAAGKDKLYFKSDNNLYLLNSSGVESLVGSTVVVNSEVCVTVGNGGGSTNTFVRRWTNSTNGTNGARQVGTAITYADSATAGSTFTINEDGIYVLSYDESLSAADQFGISLNQTTLTQAYSQLPLSEQLVGADTPSPNTGANICIATKLVAGDVIRTLWGNDGEGVNFFQKFRITKVAIQTSAPGPVTFAAALTSGYTSAGGASNPIKYDTVIYDSASAYSTGTGIYTVAYAGKYHVSALFYTLSGAQNFQLYKNGTGVAYILRAAQTGCGSLSISCNPGDTLSVSPDASATFDGNVPFLNYLSIERIN